jgi:hypothetical protein
MRQPAAWGTPEVLIGADRVGPLRERHRPPATRARLPRSGGGPGQPSSHRPAARNGRAGRLTVPPATGRCSECSGQDSSSRRCGRRSRVAPPVGRAEVGGSARRAQWPPQRPGRRDALTWSPPGIPFPPNRRLGARVHSRAQPHSRASPRRIGCRDIQFRHSRRAWSAAQPIPRTRVSSWLAAAVRRTVRTTRRPSRRSPRSSCLAPPSRRVRLRSPALRRDLTAIARVR